MEGFTYGDPLSTGAYVEPGTANFQTLYWDNATQQYLPNSVLLVDPAGMVSMGSVASATHTLNVQAASPAHSIAKFLSSSGVGAIVNNNGDLTLGAFLIITGGGSFDNTTLANGIRLITVGSNLPNIVFFDAGYFGAGIGQEQPAARLHGRSLTTEEVLRLETDDGIGTVPRINQKTFQAFVRTTNATATPMRNSVGAIAIAIPANTSKLIKIKIIARRTGGTAGTAEDTAAYELWGTFKNVAGVATLVPPINRIEAEDQPAWDANLTPAGATVVPEVTGELNNNITWYATIETNEVST